MNAPDKHIFKIEILAKDKKLLFYEWHVQKASEKNCNNCWFTSAVSIPMIKEILFNEKTSLSL